MDSETVTGEPEKVTITGIGPVQTTTFITAPDGEPIFNPNPTADEVATALADLGKQ